MAKISAKNQGTIPAAALQEAGLHAGETVTVAPVGDGERRIRRAAADVSTPRRSWPAKGTGRRAVDS